MARFVQYLYDYPVISMGDTVKLELKTTFELGEDFCTMEENKGKNLLSLGIQAEKGTDFKINGIAGYVGSGGVFEIDNIVDISSFTVGTTGKNYAQGILVNILFED